MLSAQNQGNGGIDMFLQTTSGMKFSYERHGIIFSDILKPLEERQKEAINLRIFFTTQIKTSGSHS